MKFRTKSIRNTHFPCDTGVIFLEMKEVVTAKDLAALLCN
jgi:hypothetical protein